MTDSPAGEMRGDSRRFDLVNYEVGHKSEDGCSWVIVTFDFDFAEFDVMFKRELAEKFVVELRDELVRAKQSELEWQTNTDPESGVEGE